MLKLKLSKKTNNLGWARLATNLKVDYKLEGLVARLAARPCSLSGQTLYLVPPQIDKTRNFEVESYKIKDNKIYIKPRGNFSDFDFAENQNILCDESLIEKDELEQKLVIDKTRGELGPLKYIDESSPQKKLIVDYNGKEIIIPFVDEIVTIKDDIYVDLPEGLLDL
ncbi:MAG: hypothetical protein Q4E88_01925 [Coriobacteriia bacterium]|nr:hypothetical protein [Coriobacteriia bacterium]